MGQLETTLRFETYVVLGHKYIEDLCGEETQPTLRGLGVKLVAECAMPRYVGVIHIQAGTLGWIDLLLDTTSTTRSVECVAIVCHAGTSPALTKAVGELASVYGCKAFSSV
jgi:hypothetical protein